MGGSQSCCKPPSEGGTIDLQRQKTKQSSSERPNISNTSNVCSRHICKKYFSLLTMVKQLICAIGRPNKQASAGKNILHASFDEDILPFSSSTILPK